jgi:hypothetical protein
MRDIYQTARNTIIWLGEIDTNVGFQSPFRIFSKIALSRDLIYLLAAPIDDPKYNGILDGSGAYARSDPEATYEIKAALAVLERPWWDGYGLYRKQQSQNLSL